MVQDDGSPAFLWVVHTGQLANVVHEIHADELNHAGYKKVLEYVSTMSFAVQFRKLELFGSRFPGSLSTRQFFNGN